MSNWFWVLLLVAQIAGIAVADRGGLWLARESGWSTGTATALGSAGIAALFAARSLPVGRRRPENPWRGGLRGAAWLLLLLAVFVWAHQRHGSELARARRDAQRVERLAPDVLRIVDARVHARRTTAFGDEVELRAIQGRLGEEILPERVMLGLPAAVGAATAVGGRERRAEGRGQRLLWPGAAVRLAIHVMPLRPARNPGTPDREHALARRGIAARARLVKPDWVVERVEWVEGGDVHAALGAVLRGLKDLRRALLERVQTRLSSEKPGAAVVRALALGDRADLAAPTAEAFRRLGLTHLLSVSGLHIGFVALPVAWLVVRVRTLGRRGARSLHGIGAPLLAGSLAGACYALLSGASVPALRASGLFALYALVRFVGISIGPGTALACIACLLLIASPANLFDPGACFSFAACAALVAGGAWSGLSSGPSAGAGIGGWLWDSVRISLVVSIGMLPLVELSGLPRAPLGPLVNAAAIPWAGFVVMPCAFGAAALAAISPEATRAPDVLGSLCGWLVAPSALLEHAAVALTAALPEVLVEEGGAGRLAWPWVGGAVGLGILRLRRGDLVSGAGVWIALAFLGLAIPGETGLGGGAPRAVFFDVGQADAALLEARDAVWLVDSGSGSEDGNGGRSLARALRAEGISRIDRLVITHGDLDHRGGAPRILDGFAVGQLVLPALGRPDPALDALAALAGQRGVAVRRVAAGDRLSPAAASGGLSAEVLWPPAPGPPASPAPGVRVGDESAVAVGFPARRSASRNDGSVVLRVALGGRRLLMTGDIGASVEAELLGRPNELASDLLKVAHHGSGRSSSAAFLEAVAAGIAVVSAPCAGGRGLPNATALARLRAAGAGIAWTGRDGAIRVSWGGGVTGVEDAGVSGSEGVKESAPGRRTQAFEVRQWGERRSCAEGPRVDASGGAGSWMSGS